MTVWAAGSRSATAARIAAVLPVPSLNLERSADSLLWPFPVLLPGGPGRRSAVGAAARRPCRSSCPAGTPEPGQGPVDADAFRFQRAAELAGQVADAADQPFGSGQLVSSLGVQEPADRGEDRRFGVDQLADQGEHLGGMAGRPGADRDLGFAVLAPVLVSVAGGVLVVVAVAV